jgi:hypothetical protein
MYKAYEAHLHAHTDFSDASVACCGAASSKGIGHSEPGVVIGDAN